MSDPVYTLGIEFTAGSFTNVTSRFERGQWSMTMMDMFEQPQAGDGMFQMANDDGWFSPALNVNMKPGKALKLSAVASSVSYPLFYGRVTSVSFRSELGKRVALISAVDDWDRISRLTYTTSFYRNFDVKSLFTALMSASAVNSFAADSTINESVDYAWYRDRPAMDALYEIVRSGNYSMLVDGAGTFQLNNRYASLLATNVGTFQTEMYSLQTELNQDSIINRAKIDAVGRQFITTIQTIATLGQPVLLPSSSWTGFTVAFSDPQNLAQDCPVSTLVTPVNSIDYQAFPNSDGSGVERTSVVSLAFTQFGASAVCSFFNGSNADIYLTRFQIRGYPHRQLQPLGVVFDSTSSQSTFGLKTFQNDSTMLQNRLFSENLAKMIVEARNNGREEINLTMNNEFPAMFAINPADSITLVDTFGGYSMAWRVRTADHEISLTNGLRHQITFKGERINQEPWLVLDHSTFGVLDNGRELAV